MPKIIDGTDIKSIDIAINELNNGHVIALPTETVYGLGADATNNLAVQQIFSIKDRPAINPLICHVHKDFELSAYVEVSPQARILMETFWPGPLSIICELKEDTPIASHVTAGLSSVALRAPHHPIFEEILKRFARPIAAPSANKSQSLSPTSAEHVAESLSHADIYIIDGSIAPIGLESTIIDARIQKPILLRHGAISVQDIEACLSCSIDVSTQPNKEGKVLSPGQMLKHYSPQKSLKLNITQPNNDEAWLSFGSNEINHPFELNLSETGNLDEAAKNLFSFLWKADKLNVKYISVAPIPNEGIGVAINDRLNRAAREKS